MKIGDAFPSDYLKAADLNNQLITVTIESAEMVELGQGRDKENKLALTFAGKKKKLICNPTNAKAIAKLYGDDTDDWIGKRITLVPKEVEFQGDQVWAIRIHPNKPGTGVKPASAPQPEPEPEPDNEADDNSSNTPF